MSKKEETKVTFSKGYMKRMKGLYNNMNHHRKMGVMTKQGYVFGANKKHDNNNN